MGVVGRRLRGLAIAVLGALAAPAAVIAHGPVPAEPPSLVTLVLGWTVEPFVALPLLAAAVVWLRLVGRVNAAHPGGRVPPIRTWAFLGGLVAIAVALLSGIGRYDTALFSVHMVQHLLLTLVAAPLLLALDLHTNHTAPRRALVRAAVWMAPFGLLLAAYNWLRFD
ncbi:MAG: cytochrome c oxidase assembly protein, partial [Chloroflexi bacterium]|nr:cytochrome c oxidase assembly protein [Chloroflexota bacterium]